MTSIAAVLVADLHLSDTPPAARSGEPDWRATQAGYLNQVTRLCRRHECPLVIAGDLFDDGWRERRCSPALINLALTYLPDQCYGIPGQHDRMEFILAGKQRIQ